MVDPNRPSMCLSAPRARRTTSSSVALLCFVAGLGLACGTPSPAETESEGDPTGASTGATETAGTATATTTDGSAATSSTATEGSSSGSTGTSSATTTGGESTGASMSDTAITEGTTGATTGTTSAGTTGGDTDGDTDTDTGTGGVDVLPSEGCGLEGAPVGLQKGLTTKVQGVDRSYDVYVSDPYDADQPHAVIFSYHGVGGTANTNQFRLDKNSDANDGFSINVAPQGWPSQEWDKNHFVPFNLEASVTVFDQVLGDLAANYCVDLNRVFVVGHSNGGQMAFHLGCLRGDKIRAILPSGGRCFSYGAGICDPYNGGNNQQCSGSVSVMSVMGEDDVTRHADEEATLAGYRSRQGCGASTEPVDPSPCLRFQGCNPGEEVATCRIPGLAHALWKDGHDAIYDVMMSY
jgi:poly(3-hydroxybutyrate) depolymerase